jgi:microcompartment protein CcmK/EutM
MQYLNNSFNKFKVDGLTHVKMLIIQKIQKNSQNHPNIIAKH